ncbi:MAG TPA: ATP-binding protein [Rhizomicrobium sp.]|jgi:signal transduction histidine kinase|nr:ATP-binding protein [Rhizomicrobium sp.]
MSITAPNWSWPIIAALMAALLLVIAGIAMARYEDQLYAAQQTRDVMEQAEILAASVTAAVSFGDPSAAQEYVVALEANPDLKAAGVYDGNGNLFAQFSRGQTLPPGMAAAAFGSQGVVVAGNTMTVGVPVAMDGHAIGAVTLIATTEPAQRRIARYAGLVLLVTMGALVIGVLAFSQAALSRRAAELSHVNVRLQNEMSERQKTEEALRQSHKMEAVGQLSGGIAHDFNNLIMIAQSNLRMIQKKAASGGSQSGTYVVSANEALDRAAGLTQRILAFSRRQPLSPQPARLSDLVGGMGELLRHSVGEKVKIETRLEARWWTLCDINQMENVILNLAINARDAMPEGGVLTIAIRDVTLKKSPPDVSEFVPGDYVALSISDTGEGMSDDVRQRALDPFFTTKPQGKGTGLGLSMTFGYVRQSNGYLVIESAPRKGATITIYMPRYAEEQA